MKQKKLHSIRKMDLVKQLMENPKTMVLDTTDHSHRDEFPLKTAEEMFCDHPELAKMWDDAMWLKQEIIKVVIKYTYIKLVELIRLICTMSEFQGKLYDEKYVESFIEKIPEILILHNERVILITWAETKRKGK